LSTASVDNSVHSVMTTAFDVLNYHALAYCLVINHYLKRYKNQ